MNHKPKSKLSKFQLRFLLKLKYALTKDKWYTSFDIFLQIQINRIDFTLDILYKKCLIDRRFNGEYEYKLI